MPGGTYTSIRDGGVIMPLLKASSSRCSLYMSSNKTADSKV
ncbi:MAG: hypothetical protein QXS51_06135 [Thermoproteota archaeon]